MAKYRPGTDIDTVIRQYLSISSIREKVARREMDAGRYAEAKVLLGEGIEFDNARNHSGTVTKWRGILVEIANLEGDNSALRILREELFRSDGQYDFQQYAPLKALYSDEEWPKKVEQLLAEVSKAKNIYDWAKTRAISEILYREQHYDRLVEFLKKSSIDYNTLSRYWEGLSKGHSDFLRENLTRIIRHKASGTGTRNHYQEIAQMIAKMASIPQEKPAAEALRDELIRTYPRRPAMIEELGGGGVGVAPPYQIRSGDQYTLISNLNPPSASPSAPALRLRGAAC